MHHIKVEFDISWRCGAQMCTYSYSDPSGLNNPYRGFIPRRDIARPNRRTITKRLTWLSSSFRSKIWNWQQSKHNSAIDAISYPGILPSCQVGHHGNGGRAVVEQIHQWFFEKGSLLFEDRAETDTKYCTRMGWCPLWITPPFYIYFLFLIRVFYYIHSSGTRQYWILSRTDTRALLNLRDGTSRTGLRGIAKTTFSHHVNHFVKHIINFRSSMSRN